MDSPYQVIIKSHRNQSIDLQCKLIDRFLYEFNNGLIWVNIVLNLKCYLYLRSPFPDRIQHIIQSLQYRHKMRHLCKVNN